MEAARGRTERTFRYVVRAPGGDGSDVMNVDMKIDTRWVFQEADGGGEGPEERTGSPGAGEGTPRRQLEPPEQKLPAAVHRHEVAESGLRRRIRELELSEQALLGRVDVLRARVLQERSATLRAQEQLQSLQGELAHQDPQAGAEERAARRRRDEVLGQQAAALERGGRIQRCQRALARGQERVLRAQLQRLERDVLRLRRAARLPPAEPDCAARAPGPGGPQAARPRDLQARPERGAREREEAARGRRDQRATERRLRAQVEELRCCVFALQLSEIGLQSQVEDLARQNQSLRAQLGARAPADRARSTAPRVSVAWCVCLGCGDPMSGQFDSRILVLPGASSCSADRTLNPESCRMSGEPCTWGHAGAAGDPPVLAPDLETTAELPRDLVGSECSQLTLAEPSWDEELVLLLGGCLPGRCPASPLLPVQLACISEQRRAGGPGPEAFLLVQTPTLPHWRPAGASAPLLPLLLQEASPEELQAPQGLEARPPPAEGRPCQGDGRTRSRAASPGQEPSHPAPGGGPSGAWRFWAEGEEATVGPGRACRGTEEDHGDRCWQGEGSCEHLYWEASAGSPEGVQSKKGASGTQATAPRPGRGGELPLLLLQGEVSVLGEESPTHRGRAGGQARALQQLINGPCCSCGRGPEEAGPADREDHETLFFVEEEGETPSPRLALTAEPARHPWAPSQGQDWPGLGIDEFAKEVEACLQHLCQLACEARGRKWPPLAAENWTFVPRRRGCREGQRPGRALASQGVEMCGAGAANPTEQRADGEQGDAQVPGGGGVLPGAGPGLDGRSRGPPDEPPQPLGTRLPQQLHILERARRRLHQLVSGLKKERSQVLRENARLQGDQERWRRRMRSLQEERERDAQRLSALQRGEGALAGDVARLKRELDQYLRVISDLEDCNRDNYSKISELEEENEKLKGRVSRLLEAAAGRAGPSPGVLEQAALDAWELKARLSGLGVSYKELVRDVVLGVEDLVRACRGENEQLLRRIRVLERDVVLGVRADARPLGAARELVQERSTVGQGTAVEKGVQVSQFSGQLIPGVTLEEDMSMAGGWRGPSLCAENSSCGPDAGSAAPVLPGGCAGAAGARPGDTDGAGGKEAPSEEEEGRPWSPADPGQTLRTLDTQRRGLEAESPSEEDLRLCVRRLHLQVATLQCRLRDQGSAREEALRLRDQLKGKLDELQKNQREANLAVMPLKAQLASLVQKCRERNRLISRLLQELHRHGTADPLLAERARSMVTDVALAEYVATFLPSDVPEPPLPSGLAPDPGPSLAAVSAEPGVQEEPGVLEAPGFWAEPGVRARHPQEKGAMSHAVLQADGLAPPSELLSPVRILALHKELRQSIGSHPQVDKSPLEL
ncbi:uncharacterized protein C4orf50 homolog [Talpa occidentalis]|uniref:uncharacterized protein C4orf50 homolog n=1 Tax=Talpa occidentalis TaxID=50954 RepID=UPI00188EF3C1|nr:uncharacterized protein C4orf50 homolog [Talpa occidentalis]